MSTGPEAQRLTDLLPRLLTEHSGRKVAAVTGLRTLSGGVSRLTWSFDSIDESGEVEGLIRSE